MFAVHIHTLFLQGLARVPHRQSAVHSVLFPLQGHPRVPFSFLFVLQELMQLQWLACLKYAAVYFITN